MCRFDEHALVDLPTMLDYVMKVTGQTELFYTGHSQGTVMGFAGFTANQTLGQHIKGFFALAPVSTVKHIKGLFAFITDFYKEVEVKTFKDVLVIVTNNSSIDENQHAG